MQAVVRRLLLLLVPILIAAFLAATAGLVQLSRPAPAAAPGAVASGGGPAPSLSPPPPAAGPPSHVFLVVMENKSYAEALAAPFTAQLAATYEVATEYHAVAHPSLPNYLALAAGSTFGISDDAYHRLPAGGLGAQLTEAGVPWKAYMEGMSRGCLDSPYPYALKHDPFAYFGGGCPEQVVPYSQLAGDLADPSATPRFAWITPDLCHDSHDCPVAEGDRFLAGLVPAITASAAWRDGGVLYVVWDEDDGSAANHVPALVISPSPRAHTITGAFDHYSVLAAVEDRLGVARLGQAASATPLTASLTAA